MAYNYSYNTLIDRFKAFADGHYLIRKFTHGQIDLADLDMDGEYPYMHVAPGNISPVPGAMQFGFEVLFMDLPRDKEIKAEYQRESLSDCIRLAQDLITEIASSGVLFGNETQLGTQPTITPLIEEFKHVLTGVQISLVIELPYDWSACDIPANYSVGGSGSGGAGFALGITFKVNGTDNVVQNVLDLVEGSGISIVDNGDGSVTISNTGGGGGGGAAWGSITGTLSTQTDLQNALNAKADASSLADVATSGDYNDLTNLPTIPAAQIQSDWTQANNAALDYIKNKPTIPTTLDSLTDVSASSPTNGQALVYDNGTKTWLPGTVGNMLKSVYDTDDDGTVDAAERIEIIVRNSTGVTLTKGQIVYLSGATGNRPNAVLADATDEITSSKTIGMVTANISNNADGYVAVNGTLHDLDTSAFTAGDSLWLSETAGAMQANTPPAEPAHSVFIGYVARAHPTLGRVVLAIQNGYELNELHGVLVPSPSANDVLYYDGSTSLWKNKALSKSDVGLGNVDNTSDANKPVSTAQQTAIDAKVTANAAITGATKTKITYDSKGLVTAGADITASDLPTGIDAAKIGSGAVSNTEFGYLDGVTSAIQTQLNGTQDKLVSGTNIKTINSTTVLGSGNFDLQDRLVSGTNIKTVNSNSLLGSGDVAVQATLVSGTNIKTINSSSVLGSGNLAVAAQDSISLINNTSVSLGTSTTSYVSFCAFTTNSTEANRQVIIPVAGTIKNLYVLTSTTQSAGGSQVCTVRKNTANTSVVATIAANAVAGTFSDTTNTVSVAAGDKLSLQVQNNAATGTAATIVSVAIIIERS